MSLWLVERYLPAAGLAELIVQTDDAVAALARGGIAIAYLGSTAVPEDETCFCLFECESPETIERVNDVVAAPCLRVVKAQRSR